MENKIRWLHVTRDGPGQPLELIKVYHYSEVDFTDLPWKDTPQNYEHYTVTINPSGIAYVGRMYREVWSKQRRIFGERTEEETEAIAREKKSNSYCEKLEQISRAK